MTADTEKSMNQQAAILFPHSFIPSGVSDGIFHCFSSITVCQPWFMEPSVTMERHEGRVTVLRPPDDLKPPGDFLRLLSEYRLWMSQNRGATPLPADAGNDATWDIRKALRLSKDDVSTPVDEPYFRWHLVLHLEREVEENQMAANEMLLRMKGQSPPLADALDDASPGDGLFDDLSLPDPTDFMDERRIRAVLDAWFGLFGGSLPESASLVTCLPEVLSYVADLFEAVSSTSLEDTSSSSRTIDLPPGTDSWPPKTDWLRAGLSGRRVILVDGYRRDGHQS